MTAADRTRRERQLVEIRRLWTAGDCHRAAYLAAEHLDQFPQDRDDLAGICA